MKKHLVPFLLIPFVLAGCDFKESLDNANDWVDDNILSLVTGRTNEESPKDNPEEKGEHEGSTPDPTPAHTHTWSSSYEKNDSYHWKVCTECGQIKDKEQHNLSNWRVTLEPTLFNEGKEEATCSVCGYKKTRSIPHLSHADRFIRYDDEIIFGSYPQSLVTDTDELTALEAHAYDSDEWKSYKYMVRNFTDLDIMSYKDVDLDEDGIVDYRGVYINQYRANYSSNNVTEDTTNQNSLFNLNSEYWFKYEPLAWKVINESNNGKLQLVTEKGIDSQYFNGYVQVEDAKYSHNGGNGYSNNYSLSDVRLFLNDFFYNSAFNDEEKMLIASTSVSNNAATMREEAQKYASESTQDNIFLLSSKEASDHELKEAIPATDYAMSQNAKVDNNGNASWLLRSPGEEHNKVDAVGHSSKSILGFATYSSTRPSMNIYSLNAVKVTVESNNEFGGTVSNKLVSGPSGSTAHVEAFVNAGYDFDGWYLNGVKVSEEFEYEFELPSSNSKLVAKFECKVDLLYKLEYYFQNADEESEFDLLETEEKAGKLGDLPEYEAKEFDNFTFSHVVGEDEPIKADESSVVQLYYNRNKFKLSFNAVGEHGTVVSNIELDSESKTFFEKSVTLSCTSEDGYHLEGWYIGENKVSEEDEYTFEMPAEDIEVEAKWAPNVHTLTLTSDYLDGATLVGDYQLGHSYPVNYGEEITLEFTNKMTKYDFTGWFIDDVKESSSESFSFTMPNKDITVKLGFEYGAFSYKVNYFLESDTAGEYDFLLSEIDSGIYGNTMEYDTNKDLEGFEFDHADSKLIEDKTKEEQEINVYYNRKQFNLTVFVNNNDMGETNLGNKTVAYKYGHDIVLSATPKNGSYFIGWYEGEELKSTNKDLYRISMPANDLTIEARFHVHVYDETTHYCECNHFDPTLSSVTFTVNYVTEMGQNLFIAGLNDNWEPTEAIPMTWTEGHNWTVTRVLPRNVEISYKFIMIDSNNGNEVVWEKAGEGNHRTYIPTTASANLVLTWGFY